jgi:hypothetical protein
MPNRCPVADESEELEQEVHLLLYGKRNRKYRVYYLKKPFPMQAHPLSG